MRRSIQNRYHLRVLGVMLAAAASFELAPRSVLAAGTVGTGSPASCTEAALNAAIAGGGSVTFNCGGSPTTITLTATLHPGTADSPLDIDGGGLITLTGGAGIYLLQVDEDITVKLRNLAIRNSAGFFGRIIFSEGSLTLEGYTHSSNDYTGSPGGSVEPAIFNFRGTLTIMNSTFTNNHRSDQPVLIGNGGKMAIIASSFSDNSAGPGYQGIGVLKNYFEGTAVIRDSSFTNNSSVADSPMSGGIGAIVNVGKMKIFNSTFSGNSASGGGGGTGALYNSFGKLEISGSTFATNSGVTGGALSNHGHGKIKVTNTTFSGNRAAYGGVLEVGGKGNVTFTNCTLVDNNASPYVNNGSVDAAIWNNGETKIGFKNNILFDSDCAYAVETKDKGYNLQNGDSCELRGAGCSTGASGSSRCNATTDLDPGGLADNGGATETIAVLSTSPTIDSGKCIKTDQRGFARPGADAMHCTIGAYEYNATCSATLCGSACTNLQSDSGNCGACGTVCSADQKCKRGSCR